MIYDFPFPGGRTLTVLSADESLLRSVPDRLRVEAIWLEGPPTITMPPWPKPGLVADEPRLIAAAEPETVAAVVGLVAKVGVAGTPAFDAVVIGIRGVIFDEEIAPRDPAVEDADENAVAAVGDVVAMPVIVIGAGLDENACRIIRTLPALQGLRITGLTRSNEGSAVAVERDVAGLDDDACVQEGVFIQLGVFADDDFSNRWRGLLPCGGARRAVPGEEQRGEKENGDPGEAHERISRVGDPLQLVCGVGPASRAGPSAARLAAPTEHLSCNGLRGRKEVGVTQPVGHRRSVLMPLV
jgi:hypothetical protein